jgi:hypothetical protein
MKATVKNIQFYKHFEVNSKANFLVTTLSFWLFLFSIIRAKSSGSIFGDLGLFSVLPPEYFISICLLTFSFFLSLRKSERNKKMLAVQTIMLTIILSCTPILLEGSPRFHPSLKTAGEIDYLVRHAFLNPTGIRYNNWPSIDILGTSLAVITDIDVTKFLLFSPLFSNLLYLLIVFTLFSKTLDDDLKVWLASWIYVLLNWLNQDYFSPQNGAYIIYLLIILIFYLSINKINDVSIRILSPILIISLVTYHLLTPFVLILNLLSFVLINGIKQFPSLSSFIQDIKKFPNINLLFLLLIVVFLSWEMYGATSMFSTIIHLLKNFLHSNNVVSSTESLMTRGSPNHELTTRIRMNFAVLIVFIASIGAFHLFFIEKKRTLFSITMLAIMCTNLGLTFTGGYGGEILIRIMLFSLLPLSFFIAQNINIKNFNLFLVLFILTCPLLHVIAHYGNERIDYIAPSDIKGSDFFFDYVKFNSTILDFYDTLQMIKYIEKYHHSLSYPTKSMWKSNKSPYIWVTWCNTHTINYLIDKQDSDFLGTFFNNLNSSIDHEYIYSNGIFNLYKQV